MKNKMGVVRTVTKNLNIFQITHKAHLGIILSLEAKEEKTMKKM